MHKIVGLIVAAVVFVGLPVYVYQLTNNKLNLGYNQGYEPDQPIPYSHELHAGKYKIDCQYCHTSADKSRHAGVPSLNICMNCHMTVKTDSPHIQKLMTAYSEGKPVVWKKVTLLPDHVKFSHAPHVLAGKSCQECHGAIETMPVVSQHSDLSMGWCVNCHRKPENNAPTNCSTCHY